MRGNTEQKELRIWTLFTQWQATATKQKRHSGWACWGIRLAIEKFCRHLHFTATFIGICLEFILYISLRLIVQFNLYIYGFPLKIFIHQNITPNIIFDNLAYALQVCGSMLA